jgi:hypothetical protein
MSVSVWIEELSNIISCPYRLSLRNFQNHPDHPDHPDRSLISLGFSKKPTQTIYYFTQTTQTKNKRNPLTQFCRPYLPEHQPLRGSRDEPRLERPSVMTKRLTPRQAVDEWFALNCIDPWQAECKLKGYDRGDALDVRLGNIRFSAACLADAVKDGMPRDEIVRHLMQIHQGVWHVHAAVYPTAPTLNDIKEEWNESEELPAWTWMRTYFSPDDE